MEKIYGLLGRTLGHSWSAPIHKALGCEGYRLFELEPGELEGFLRREDVGGLNVTIPYKRDVMKYCDALDPAAEAIGSVNTLVRREGKLYGYNTDIDGFLYMLRRAEISLRGKKAVILGSGGASLTAQAAARQEGAREIVVVSRTGEVHYENLPERHADAEVLVNTTPVGMWPNMDGAPVDLRLLPAVTAVVDVIYNPGRTDLLLQAEEIRRAFQALKDGTAPWSFEENLVRSNMKAGLTPEGWEKKLLPLGIRSGFMKWTGGLPMLVAQAAKAEELFFDKVVPALTIDLLINKLRRDQANLVLAGMPGSGKTTVGRELARLSGKPFVDLDEEIVRKAGKPIPEIFASQGEGPFRQLEHEVLTEACSRSGQIIATGGGAVLWSENRAAMRRTGRVYHLRRRLEDLPTEGRPLSQAGKLAEMERVRDPLYTAAADCAVSNEFSPEETAGTIWRDFCER